MKTWINKLKIAFLAVLCVIGIAGCSAGSSVETKLTINEDLSGVRVMDVAIDASVFAENFHGDINALNAVVEANCPKDLTWTYDNSDGTDRYHVELAFTSPEDYKKKVETIVGEEVNLEISAPDTVWANGFRVYENFTSTDLLEWLKTVLVEGGLVDQDDASYIFENGATEVVYAGTPYDANSSIQVNELEYLSLDKVDVLTNVKDSNLYDRSVVVYIPKASMDVKKAEIEAFLNGNVPEGAASSWEAYENGTKMTISAENMDAAGLNAFNQKVLASEKNLVEVAKQSGDEGIFSFTDSWNEQMDLSAYAGDESGRVRFGYYMKAENGVELKRNPDAEVSFRLQEDETYPSYGIVKSDRISETTIQFLAVKSYLLGNTQVTTEAKGSDKFTRTSVFSLTAAPAEAEQTEILNRITSRAGELAEVTAAVDEAGIYSVTVTQEGSEEELDESCQAVFGNGLSIGKAEEKGLMAVSHRIGFYERFDYSAFTEAVSDDYMLTYTAKMGLLESINKKSLPQDELDAPTVKGKTVTYETAEQSVRIQFSGSKLNLVGILIWIVIIAAAVFLLWNLKKSGVFEMAKEDLAAMKEQKKQKDMEKAAAAAENAKAAAVPNGAGELSEQEKAQMEAAATASLFCPNCGHPYVEGTVFCENCGSRLTEQQ